MKKVIENEPLCGVFASDELVSGGKTTDESNYPTDGSHQMEVEGVTDMLLE